MKMQKNNAKKHRRKVIVSRRHHSSNRSLSLVNIGTNRRKVTALLKNNKSLAHALQDARCELSVKQKLLENAAKHFKDIMQARVKMLEMYSNLKSLVKNFDDTLLFLNVNDIKISDLIVPLRSCSQFKSKMKKLGESVEEVSEEDSFSVEPVRDNCDVGVVKSSNQTISCGHSSSAVSFIPMEVTDGCADKIRTNFETEHDLPDKICIESKSTLNSRNCADTIDARSSFILCENSEGVIDPTVEKQASLTEIDASKCRESSGTPQLCIPDVKPLMNREISNLKACSSFQIPSFPSKNTSKVQNTPVSSSQKVQSSRIPRLHDLSVGLRMESNSSAKICKNPKTTTQKTLKASKESDLKIGRRKTFVVKNCVPSASNSESTTTLNQNEIRNENDLNEVEDSVQDSRRKTFVIKNIDTSENKRKSTCNRRKTFVKKPTGSKTRKSIKNRRDTLTLSDNRENGANSENVTDFSVISVSNIKEKSCLLSSERKIPEELPIVCEETNEITENANTFQENLVDTEMSSSAKTISLQNHSEDIPSQGKNTESKVNETNLNKEELMLRNGNNNIIKENSSNAENMNEIVVTYDSSKSSDFCIASSNCAQPVISDTDNIEMLGIHEDIHCLRSRKRVSYKVFLDSSDSDCEFIPDFNFQSVNEPSAKPVPIRKRVSGSQKKVFVFNAHKRKSLQRKKSCGKGRRISVKHPYFLNEGIDVPHFSKHQDEKKFRENITSDLTDNMLDIEESITVHSEAPCIMQEMLPSASSGRKDIENPKSVEEENFKDQDKITKLAASKRGKNIKKNSLLHCNSPVIASDKFLNAIEHDSVNFHCSTKDSSEGQGDKISKSKSQSRVKKNNIGKNKKVKRHSLKDDIPVDCISVKKTAERNNSDKQSEQIVNSDLGGEINNLPLKNKNRGKGTKHKNKGIVSKKKSPTNKSIDNTIVVQAEVHPTPQISCLSEYGVHSKENRKGKPVCENYQVSVVLSDILQSANIDISSLSCKEKIVSKDTTNIPLKTPLSDNSSNIQTSVINNHNNKIEGSIPSDAQEIKYSKRNRAVNYAEPSLRKKLRK